MWWSSFLSRPHNNTTPLYNIGKSKNKEQLVSFRAALQISLLYREKVRERFRSYDN